MKKIVLFVILLALSFTAVFGDYSRNIRDIENSISVLQSEINKYEAEKQLMIFEYNSYIQQLKQNENIEKQQANAEFARLGLTFSTGAANTLESISKKYRETINTVENEKNYNIGVYNDAINILRLRITENESLKNEIYKYIKLDQINERVINYNANQNYDQAIEESKKGLSIAKQYNFTSYISFYEKWINDIQQTKDEITKNQNEQRLLLKSKQIIEESSLYFEKGIEEDKKGNYNKSIDYINQGILLLENNSVDGGQDLINRMKDYRTIVENFKELEEEEKRIEKQQQIEEQKNTEYRIQQNHETKLKEEVNKVFPKIKNIVNKRPISRQLGIYKGLLLQLERYQNDFSGDQLVVLNELIRLFKNEISRFD